MRLIPNSNGDDAQPVPLREDNYCHMPDGRLAPKGQGQCARTGSAFVGRSALRPKLGPAPGGRTADAFQRAGAREAPRRAQPVEGDAFVGGAPGRGKPASSGSSDLSTSDITQVGHLGGGVSESYLVKLRTPDGREVKGVFKPEDGESKGIRSTLDDYAFTQAEREVMATELDHMIGTNLAPDAVMREVQIPREYDSDGNYVSGYKRKRGSIEGFVPNAEVQDTYRYGSDAKPMTTEDQYKFAVLDMMIGNTDRHTHNYMRDKDTGKAWAIDNGLSFPSDTTELRSAVIDRMINHLGPPTTYAHEDYRQTPPIPERLRKTLLTNINAVDWRKWAAGKGLPHSEISAFIMRVGAVKDGLIAGGRQLIKNAQGLQEDWY